jgi:type VI secretion system protein ImpK
VQGPDATVFDPGISQHPPAGWASGTVIYQGAPIAEIGLAADASIDEAISGHAAPVSAIKISQKALLDAGDSIQYSSANPLISAAAPLLILFSHLRLTTVEKQAAPLASHVASSIEEFERKIAEANVPEEDARIAKFVLCEVADDIIGNLPGPDRDTWKQHSVLSRFFQVGSPGTGFYTALNTILANPEAHYDLLELMHACLSLGFEGQYRGLAREADNLERVRRDVYETLRYFKARADDDISPRWQGLSAMMPQSLPRVPLWAIAAAMSAALAGAFFTLRILITNEGDALAGELLALNPSTPVVIERANFVPFTEEVKITTTQIDRIRASLARDIEGGGLTVETKGEFIVVEINNLLAFQPGKADLKADFDPIAARIAAALEHEPGAIRIVGHTDDIKPRKSSVFKSNYDLSVARAEAVEKVIAAKIGDPSRITVEGRGEDEPIADNKTPEGRARNRRVELMIPRQETL